MCPRYPVPEVAIKVLECACLWEEQTHIHSQEKTQREREWPGSPEVSISLAVKEQSSLEALSCLSAARLLDTRHSLHLDELPELPGALIRPVRTLQPDSKTTWPNSTHFQLFSTMSSFSLACFVDQNQMRILETEKRMLF